MQRGAIASGAQLVPLATLALFVGWALVACGPQRSGGAIDLHPWVVVRQGEEGALLLQTIAKDGAPWTWPAELRWEVVPLGGMATPGIGAQVHRFDASAAPVPDGAGAADGARSPLDTLRSADAAVDAAGPAVLVFVATASAEPGAYLFRVSVTSDGNEPIGQQLPSTRVGLVVTPAPSSPQEPSVHPIRKTTPGTLTGVLR